MISFSDLRFPEDHERSTSVHRAAVVHANYSRKARNAARKALGEDFDDRQNSILYRLLDGPKEQRWLHKELGIPVTSLQVIKKDFVKAGLIVNPSTLVPPGKGSQTSSQVRDDKWQPHVFQLTEEGDLSSRKRFGEAQSVMEIGLNALSEEEREMYVALIRKMDAALDTWLQAEPDARTSAPAPFERAAVKRVSRRKPKDLQTEPSPYKIEQGNVHSAIPDDQAQLEKCVPAPLDDQTESISGEEEPSHQFGTITSAMDELNWFEEDDEEQNGDPPLREHEHMIRHQQILDREEEERWREADARWSKPFPGIARCVSDHLTAIAAFTNTLDDFDGGPKAFNSVQYDHSVRPSRFNPYRLIQAAKKAAVEIDAFFEDRDTSTVRHIGFRTPVNRVHLRWLADDWKVFQAEALKCIEDLSDAGLLRPHVMVFQFKVDERTQLVDVHCHAIVDMGEDARADVLDLLEERFIDCWIDESPHRDPASTMRYIHPGFSLPNMLSWTAEALEHLYYALRSEKFIHYFGAFSEFRRVPN